MCAIHVIRECACCASSRVAPVRGALSHGVTMGIAPIKVHYYYYQGAQDYIYIYKYSKTNKIIVWMCASFTQSRLHRLCSLHIKRV